MIIGIDFDGTIADTNTEKAAWVKCELGMEIEPFLCDRTCCTKIIGEGEYNRMSKEVFSAEATLRVRPVPGALEALKALRRVHALIVITARTGPRLDAATEWLERYQQAQGLRCIGIHADRVSKAETCIREGAAVLVDDDERHVYKAVSEGLRAVLFKNSAPVGFERDGVEMSRSWKEVVGLLGVTGAY